MTQQNVSTISLDYKDVHQALKRWSKDNSPESSIGDLYLVQRRHEEGLSVRQATNQVLIEALDVLEVKRPKDANLLRLRFIDGRAIHQLANSLNVVQSMVYKMQRAAIEHLTAVLSQMEREARASERLALEKRLPLPTSLDLVGISKHLNHLEEVLVAPEPPWLFSIEGLGGIGKTTLADALVRQLIGKRAFCDFGWVSAKQELIEFDGMPQSIDEPPLSVDALVEALVEQLLGLSALSPAQALAALSNRLKEKSHLIVIDNLETFSDVQRLLPTLRRLAEPTKFLLTSRDSLYAQADVYHFVVPQLSFENALQLIREEVRLRHLPHLASASDEDLLPIYETVGGNPLALRLVIGQTHTHPLHVLLNDLVDARSETAENLYTYIYRRAWDNLDQVTRQAFLFMLLAPAEGADLAFLKPVSALDERQLRHALGLLVRLNLVELRGGLRERRYSIHQLTRTFLQEQVLKWQ